MSLRHVSKAAFQASMRVMQGIKDQVASKRDSTVRSLRDATSNSRQVRKFSGGTVDQSREITAAAAAARAEKLKQAEESLRTVMYLSCWGPN